MSGGLTETGKEKLLHKIRQRPAEQVPLPGAVYVLSVRKILSPNIYR